ncbi:MAG: LLM class flavin-dependent oxidoreductase [Chloroflexi bacterium]|nr:LLM class flavin-dependent oxidoreductase [Chloroflexota bacterium]
MARRVHRATAPGTDTRPARRRGRARRALYAELMTRYGWGEVTARVQECWREGDRAGAATLISDEILDEVAVAGEPDECRARLGWHREQGIALPILCPPHGATGAMIERTIRELAPARLG